MGKKEEYLWCCKRDPVNGFLMNVGSIPTVFATIIV